jgi:hypothetical protein
MTQANHHQWRIWWTSMTTAAAGGNDTNPREESSIHSVSQSVSQWVSQPAQTGNEPTCVTQNRMEVTDLTKGTNKIWNLVSSWHVCEDLLSDQIETQYYLDTFRDSKTATRQSYKDDLQVIQHSLSVRHRSGCWPAVTSHHLILSLEPSGTDYLLIKKSASVEHIAEWAED